MDKSYAEILKDNLFYKRKNVNLFVDEDEEYKIEKLSDEYKKFLNNAKTERKAINTSIIMLQENGFENFDSNKKYKAGDKVYYINKSKSIICTIFGQDNLENGVNIIASHIDSPRLDLKPSPLYEEGSIAFLKTHYYGGLKKYQWTTIPLCLVGVIVKEDGTIIDISIGEDENDPVFCVTDLLPHLASNQMKKPVSEFIAGEQLNILFGLKPFKDKNISEKVKLNILNILYDKYDIKEEDFHSSEIEAVPAFNARDVGLDRSMIGGYGHDDRVCAFISLYSVLNIEKVKKTCVIVLADKEEIGSTGSTGLESEFLKYYIYKLAKSFNVDAIDILSNSKCLSADVSAGFDPNYSDVYEKNNTAYLNHGTSIMKYTGSRGKGGTNDASAEYFAEIKKILNENNVIWQSCELGKVDSGGGGTVAMYISRFNIDTIDIGVPVVSMHSPFEIVSKSDIYMTFKAFKAFLEN